MSRNADRSESPSAEAERLLYYAIAGAMEEGLVQTAEHVLTVLRQASAPLGPIGEEWLKRQGFADEWKKRRG